MFAPKGSIVGSCTFLYLTDRFGFGIVSTFRAQTYAFTNSQGVVFQVIVVASISMMVAYTLEAAAVPFPVFVISYFFNGYGSAHLVSPTLCF